MKTKPLMHRPDAEAGREFTGLDKLAGQKAPGIFLSGSPALGFQTREAMCPVFYMDAGV